MYHSFSRTTTPAFRDLTVSPELLAEHLAALRQSGFRFIAVRDVPAALREEPPGARLAAVSIDDGLADGLEAAEIFAAQRLPATYFVPTAFVGATSRWLDGDDASRPMLTWHDMADLAGAGMEIGAHGHAHIAADLNREELVRAVYRGDVPRRPPAAPRHGRIELRLPTLDIKRATSRRAIAAAGFAMSPARCSKSWTPAAATTVSPCRAFMSGPTTPPRTSSRGACGVRVAPPDGSPTSASASGRPRASCSALVLVPRVGSGGGEAIDPSVEQTVPPLGPTR